MNNAVNKDFNKFNRGSNRLEDVQYSGNYTTNKLYGHDEHDRIKQLKFPIIKSEINILVKIPYYKTFFS